MKILCWNVQGLGMPRTVRRLQHMLRDINPSVVFLSETKLRSAQMAQVRRRCGFINVIDVDAVGRSGGLSLGWKNNCGVSLCSYSQRHIDVIINEDSDGNIWRCTGFYGVPEEQHRAAAWNLLRQINDMPEIPWVIIGDFNEIAYSNEKQGGLTRSERQMSEFRRVLSDCEVEDMGYRGRWYTWEKGNFATNNIRERLDRGLRIPHGSTCSHTICWSIYHTPSRIIVLFFWRLMWLPTSTNSGILDLNQHGYWRKHTNPR
ncbi:hypothetical protein HRI_003841400 [Hibiscus trionum]|uniref:Endonuclease/exonuclease/phosphatase domain-containing protein n=1 Tax=Hibiscus trionum TaxID=183268 RepID=A0A9W7MIG1_HIBTR|nr:hypothetical protein HRI_003841400 [Hibiscus trionum]